MYVSVRSFHLAKEGNQPEEYEDAFAVNMTAGRLAVADGASDSYDSARWARLLVDAYVAAPPSTNATDVRAWLAEPARAWLAGLGYATLPWNHQAKARLGAHCTLLGVAFRVEPGPDRACGAWRAMAVGDTCLFHIRDGVLVAAFPLAGAAAFSTSPALLTTNTSYRGLSVEHLTTAEGDLRRGDTLLLATDALAQWFLRRHEAGERPWEAVPAGGAFGAFIAEQRAQRRLRNDDVTLLVVHIDAAGQASCSSITTAIVPKELSDRWLRLWR